MKPRSAPRPIDYKKRPNGRLAYDPQVIKWSKRLTGDPDIKPRELSEDQLAFVQLEVIKRRNELEGPESADLYVKAMHETTPILAAPDLNRQELVEDMRTIWAQPEMRGFWKHWKGQAAKKGPKPNFMTGKAQIVAMGTCGSSAHADDIYSELMDEDMWSVFEDLEGEQAEPTSYQNALKQLPRLNCQERAKKSNIAMVKELARLFPGRGIGERLMIDGMALPAWCKQAPTAEGRQEEYRRRFTPEAGYRAYIHGPRSKKNLKGTETGTASTFLRAGKAWRGYYLVVIADQATGLPLVWMIVDAATDEARCIVPLLSDLYRYWPDCPAKMIVGDSAWDEDEWCRVAEVDYGIHPIFRLHDEKKMRDVSEFSRDGKIAGMNGKGQLISAQTGELLDFVAAELGQRKGLKPGQSSKEGDFRVRGKSRSGILSLRMEADWSRLTFYPHHEAGSTAKRRYAYRQAMLTRLNGMEGIFNRLQAGRNLGTKGADRTRIRDKGAVEAIISIALMSMTAAMLADQRAQRGETYDLPPAGPRPQGGSNGNDGGRRPKGPRSPQPNGGGAAVLPGVGSPVPTPAVASATPGLTVSGPQQGSGQGEAPSRWLTAFEDAPELVFRG